MIEEKPKESGRELGCKNENGRRDRELRNRELKRHERK